MYIIYINLVGAGKGKRKLSPEVLSILSKLEVGLEQTNGKKTKLNEFFFPSGLLKPGQNLW